MHSRYFVRTIKCNSATTSIQVYENSARNVLYKVMLELGIPVELRSLTKTTLPHSTVQVRINNSVRGTFEPNVELNQGDELAALLFSLAGCTKLYILKCKTDKKWTDR